MAVASDADTSDVIADPPVGAHICWAYDDPGDYFARVGAYVSGGLQAGQRVACYFSAARHDAASGELRAAVPGFDAAVDAGALIIGSIEESYLREGGFDADARLSGYAAMVDDALVDGFRALRVLGDVHSALDAAGDHEWAAYELRADLLAARLPLTALCTYDVEKCGEDALRLVRSVHGAIARSGDDDSHNTLEFRLRAGSTGVVAVAGEVDAFSSDIVGGVLVRAVVDVPDAVVDVSGLDFIDAAGMRALARTIGAAPGSPRISGASASFRKLWDILGCDSAVSVEFVA